MQRRLGFALLLLGAALLIAVSPKFHNQVEQTSPVRTERLEEPTGAASAPPSVAPALPLPSSAAPMSPPPPIAHGPSTGSLLTRSDLKYLGAFRLPSGSFNSPVEDGFSYGGTLAYNPEQNSLFVVGHAHHQLLAEISIPKIVKSRSLDDLETATVLQPFIDMSEGKRDAIAADIIGGLLIHNKHLYSTAYIYYDAEASQQRSHFISDLDFSVKGEVKGAYRVGELGAGFVSGYLTTIPTEWQAALGGTAITGNCCIPIISRTSYGPAAFAFNPDDLGAKRPVPTTPLIYYPAAHPLSEWGSTNPYFNGATSIRGIVFPDSSRSLLFFGSHGTGEFCYGTGDGCHDPASSAQGTHAYPYAYQVWAYDVLDLRSVKEGEKQPWEVRPYAIWNFDLPFAPETREINGATYDQKQRRIFLSQAAGDNELPVIHVFEVR